jgi:anti-repressor protein
MNELLVVNFENADRPTVSGRALHEALEVRTAYKDWFPRMCDYGFDEGKDFSSILSESTGGRPAMDHQLTIDMAKEIAMIQRTEKGKQVREYFIGLEKKWNSPEQVMARALLIANERIETRDKVISMQTDKILKLKPKADFFDLTMNKNDLFTIQEAAQMIGVPGIGQNNLFKFLRQESIMQFRNPLPMQQYIDRGYFKVKNDPWESPDGNVYFSPKTLVTQKGLYFIAKRLEAKGYLPKRNLFS